MGLLKGPIQWAVSSRRRIKWLNSSFLNLSSQFTAYRDSHGTIWPCTNQWNQCIISKCLTTDITTIQYNIYTIYFGRLILLEYKG